MRWTRQIWMKGSKSPNSDVSVPMAWSAIIEPAEITKPADERSGPSSGLSQGTEGLQMREVWLYWGTGPLMKFMKGDAVAFQLRNPNVAENLMKAK
jgi:hypothetical protein